MRAGWPPPPAAVAAGACREGSRGGEEFAPASGHCSPPTAGGGGRLETARARGERARHLGAPGALPTHLRAHAPPRGRRRPRGAIAFRGTNFGRARRGGSGRGGAGAMYSTEAQARRALRSPDVRSSPRGRLLPFCAACGGLLLTVSTGCVRASFAGVQHHKKDRAHFIKRRNQERQKAFQVCAGWRARLRACACASGCVRARARIPTPGA